MKVYNRQDFLKLPSGTFFAKGHKWIVDGFCIKGDTWTNDFLYKTLVDIDSHDSNQWADRLEEMLDKGTSYPINESEARDGMFDDEDVLLVFEDDDLKYIRKLINEKLGDL